MVRHGPHRRPPRTERREDDTNLLAFVEVARRFAAKLNLEGGIPAEHSPAPNAESAVPRGRGVRGQAQNRPMRLWRCASRSLKGFSGEQADTRSRRLPLRSRPKKVRLWTAAASLGPGAFSRECLRSILSGR